ncbi:MAG: signal peptidase I [Lachnospiraceae bacterium]|nr:signal peptidase I [Lachnospiraceae bacterium]
MRRRSGLDFSRRRRKVNRTLAKEVFTWSGEIAIVILFALVLMYFFGYRTDVVGQSMLGTLAEGDSLLVNRFVYKLTPPKENDIVVFLPNGNKKSYPYVKRVIGVPGDVVQIKEGVVYVNGEKFEEVIDPAKIEHPELAEEEVEVGEDEYFVLGDNRNNSEDSRYANIGNVKKEHIVGKAWFITSPLKNFGFIE